MTFEEAKALAAKNVCVRPATSGRLAGKIAIVTGAAQGFGYGIAKEMLKQGDIPSLLDNLHSVGALYKEVW